MHQYKIIAQIYLILSSLNLVLAAPLVVQRIHEARGDDSDLEIGTAKDVAAMPNQPNESGDLDGTGRLASSPS